MREGCEENVTCSDCYDRAFFACDECGTLHYRYNQVRHPDTGQSICYECDERISTWDATPLLSDSGITELRSNRRFGIELETDRCNGYRKLQGKTIYGAKYDGSISGMEFVSPILQGDKGLWATRGFCTRAKHRGFRIDSDCGFHLHFDVSGNTNLQRRHIAAAYAYTYHFWTALVQEFRSVDCRWCQELSWRGEEMRDMCNFERFCNNQGRYQWFNVNSLQRHGTFEVRLHEGTLDSRRICNWVKAHLRFADYVQDMKFSAIRSMFYDGPWEQTRKAVMNTWNDPRLSLYFRKVALSYA
jgi:hypothetical protein